jgi:hypothetical protein
MGISKECAARIHMFNISLQQEKKKTWDMHAN